MSGERDHAAEVRTWRQHEPQIAPRRGLRGAVHCAALGLQRRHPGARRSIDAHDVRRGREHRPSRSLPDGHFLGAAERSGRHFPVHRQRAGRLGRRRPYPGARPVRARRRRMLGARHRLCPGAALALERVLELSGELRRGAAQSCAGSVGSRACREPVGHGDRAGDPRSQRRADDRALGVSGLGPGRAEHRHRAGQFRRSSRNFPRRAVRPARRSPSPAPVSSRRSPFASARRRSRRRR